MVRWLRSPKLHRGVGGRLGIRNGGRATGIHKITLESRGSRGIRICIGGKLGFPDIFREAGRLGYVCRRAAYPNPPAQRGNWGNSSCLAAYSTVSAPPAPWITLGGFQQPMLISLIPSLFKVDSGFQPPIIIPLLPLLLRVKLGIPAAQPSILIFLFF